MGDGACQDPIRRYSFSRPEILFRASNASEKIEWITSRQNHWVALRRPSSSNITLKRSSKSPRTLSRSSCDINREKRSRMPLVGMSGHSVCRTADSEARELFGDQY